MLGTYTRLARKSLHDQSGLFPNLERDGGTPWREVNQRQGYLCRAIDQRLPVMGHAKRIESRREVGVPTIRREGKVVVRDHLEATNSGVYETAKVEARNDTVSLGVVQDLRTLVSQLEVRAHHFLDGGWMSEDVRRFGTRLAQKAVETLSRERTGSGLIVSAIS